MAMGMLKMPDRKGNANCRQCHKVKNSAFPCSSWGKYSFLQIMITHEYFSGWIARLSSLVKAWLGCEPAAGEGTPNWLNWMDEPVAY